MIELQLIDDEMGSNLCFFTFKIAEQLSYSVCLLFVFSAVVMSLTVLIDSLMLYAAVVRNVKMYICDIF